MENIAYKQVMEELIPGLPEEIARECLIRVPFHAFASIRRVCRNWKEELDSGHFHRLRRSASLTHPVIAFAQAEPAIASDGPARKYAASAPRYRLVLFEPVTGTWSCLPPVPWLPSGLPLFCQLAAVGTELVVVGGWDPESLAASDGVHVYDFLSVEWRRGAPMSGPRRSFFACAPAPELRVVFVAGGHDEEKNALRSAMAYDVGGDKWVALPDMARERDECRAVCAGGWFHVMGGYATESQGRFSNTTEAFDAAAWCWPPWRRTSSRMARAQGCAWPGATGVCTCVVPAARWWPWTMTAGRGGLCRNCRRTRGCRRSWLPCRNLMVMGSENHGGGQTVYVMEEIPDAKDGKTTTAMACRRVAAPEEFSGHVQASCYMELCVVAKE